MAVLNNLPEPPCCPAAGPAATGLAANGLAKRVGAALLRPVWVAAPARDLALFRIALFSALLTCPEVYAAPAWSRLPRALVRAPVGLHWATGWLPGPPWLATAATAALIGAAALALVGLWTSASSAVAALGALYVLAIPQCSGSVMHTHHLVWFSVLLAASPCGDALSIDARRRRRRGLPEPLPGVAYGLPVRVAWLCIGLIFFFPGCWKWRASGLSWALSDNLRNQLYQKWFEQQWPQPPRIDRWPALLQGGALATLLFEVSFIFFVFFRRTRPFAVVGALLFHCATWVLMGIGFGALWICYLVFWGATGAPTSLPGPRPSRSTLFVAAVLLAGVVGFGLTGIEDGWPFACYPTFRYRAGTTLPTLQLEGVDAAGRTVELPQDALAGPAGQRLWGVMWSALAHGAPAAGLRAYWQLLLVERPQLASYREVRFYAAERSVLPDEAGKVVRRRLLASEGY